jgi:hypothetical protein
MEEERLRMKNLSLKQQSINKKEATLDMHRDQNKVGKHLLMTPILEIQRVHSSKGARGVLKTSPRL